MPIVLETERLLLRELDGGDLPFLVALLGDLEVMRWFPAPLTPAEARAWLERQRERYRDLGYGYWLTVRRSDAQPLGQIGVLPADVGRGVEPALGWILAREFQGRGYATEGARGALAWAWRELRPARVLTLIRPENLASLAVAERLSMRAQGTIEHFERPHVLLELLPEAD